MLETLQKLINQLETMTCHRMSISKAIDVIESSANTYDELVVINVIRESYQELSTEKHACNFA